MLNIARLPVELGFWSQPIRANADFYWFVFGCFVVATLALWRLVNSPFGKVVQAIKQGLAFYQAHRTELLNPPRITTDVVKR